jgi:hypothetical protein
MRKIFNYELVFGVEKQWDLEWKSNGIWSGKVMGFGVEKQWDFCQEKINF